jgi:hypothetical protein
LRLRELYERPLVLVRPDGHVAWRGDSLLGNAAEIIDRVRGACQIFTDSRSLAGRSIV